MPNTRNLNRLGLSGNVAVTGNPLMLAKFRANQTQNRLRKQRNYFAKERGLQQNNQGRLVPQPPPRRNNRTTRKNNRKNGNNRKPNLRNNASNARSYNSNSRSSSPLSWASDPMI